MTKPALPKRFDTIEVDMSQRGAWRLLTEPRRIIAALKACDGIPTDELERRSFLKERSHD